MCSSVVNTSHSSNYLKQFRDSSSLELQKLSAVQFMSVWEHYDQDGENILLKVWNILMSNIFFFFTGNGFIEGEELNAFLREFIASVNSEENFQVFLLENFLMS